MNQGTILENLPNSQAEAALETAAATFENVNFKHPIAKRAQVTREGPILAALLASDSTLHVGCSDHPFTQSLLANKESLLHARLLEKSPNVVGFDISPRGIALLRKTFPRARFVEGDAEDLTKYLNEERFQLIVAGEVLEHLSNPGAFLESCTKVLKPGGTLLLTVPNAFGFRRLIHVMLGVENYHPDHTFYLSENTVKVLAGRYGLRIRQSFYYETPRLGSLRKKILYFFVERLPAALFGNHLLEGLVIELVREP